MSPRARALRSAAPSGQGNSNVYPRDASAPQRKPLRELSWMQFDRWVQTLAAQVRGDFAPTAVVGIAHGGVFAGGALAAALGADFFPVRISRRSRDVVRKTPKLSGEMPRELKGRKVLLVDDLAASGDTLELALALARKLGAREVRTLALVCRESQYAPDYLALTTDDLVVFPWDYDLQLPASYWPQPSADPRKTTKARKKVRKRA